jgi:hypothetical protein
VPSKTWAAGASYPTLRRQSGQGQQSLSLLGRIHFWKPLSALNKKIPITSRGHRHLEARAAASTTPILGNAPAVPKRAAADATFFAHSAAACRRTAPPLTRMARSAIFAATCTAAFGTVVFLVHRIQQDERQVRHRRFAPSISYRIAAAELPAAYFLPVVFCSTAFGSRC